MSRIEVEVSKVIPARPETVYAVLSDYREGHPAILPKPYFTSLTVEQGGQGAGTVIRVQMRVMGQEFHYHQIVSEPVPGRVLVEKDLDTDLTTTFTITSLNGGQQSQVTIVTNAAASAGFKGWLESLLNPPVMRRIYRQELQNLADYVRPN